MKTTEFISQLSVIKDNVRIYISDSKRGNRVYSKFPTAKELLEWSYRFRGFDTEMFLDKHRVVSLRIEKVCEKYLGNTTVVLLEVE
jgi:hypothetical protein